MRRSNQAFLPSAGAGAGASAGGSGAFSGAGAALQGAAQAELQAAPPVAQQEAAAPQQAEVGQQVLQPLPQAAAQALPQGAAQLPQPLPQAFPQGAAQLLQPPPQGAAQLGAGQQALAPQQPRLRRARQRPASASLVKATRSAAKADRANSLRIMMCDSSGLGDLIVLNPRRWSEPHDPPTPGRHRSVNVPENQFDGALTAGVIEIYHSRCQMSQFIELQQISCRKRRRRRRPEHRSSGRRERRSSGRREHRSSGRKERRSSEPGSSGWWRSSRANGGPCSNDGRLRLPKQQRKQQPPGRTTQTAYAS